MASLQFNAAPIDSNEEGKNNDETIGTINDNTADSTATAGQGRTPRWVHFGFDYSLAQAMTVTLGMQLDSEDPNNKEDDNQEAASVNHGTSRSTLDNDPYGTGLNGNGPFLKICKGLSANINQAMAVQVAREAFKTILEDTITPDLCIQVLTSEQLAPFPLLAIMADNHIVVVHGIWCLIVPLVQTHSLKNQVLAFIGEAWGVSGFPMVVKLDKDDFEERKDWSHPNIDNIMNVIDEKK